jgi:predicted RNase H-like HicB family nuclease/predicted RNA binding protein YcfA (HicA-like mRNA interferase family)
MPKKYREARRILAAAGWMVVRHGGSHELCAHPERSQRIAAADKDSDTVPVGTLGSTTRERSRHTAMSEYVVIYEHAEDAAWGAYLPDLPGVVALCQSREEVGERIQEALSAYVEDLHQRGEVLPAPHHSAGTVAA